MMKKLVLGIEIKKGKTQSVKLISHEIEFDFKESQELILNLYKEQEQKETNDQIPLLNVMYNTYLKNVIKELSALIEGYQIIHPLQESGYFHYSLNGESVFSTSAQVSSKELVLQVAEKFLQESHNYLFNQIKEILNKNNFVYKNENSFVINSPLNGVW